jgi:hypothetical protein
MIRAIISLVTRLGAISDPLPTTTLRNMRTSVRDSSFSPADRS